MSISTTSRTIYPARVLVVGDEPPLRRLLETVFETAGIEVVEAASVADAQQRLGVAARDLGAVVLDLVRAEAQGLELLNAIRRDPKLAWLPVIFVAGRLGEQDRLRALRAGADIFVAKPFSVRGLQQLVLRLVRDGRPILPELHARRPVQRPRSRSA